MPENASKTSVANRFLPPLFQWFFAALAIGWAVGLSTLQWESGLLLGFDFAALVFFARTVPAFSRNVADLRKIAEENDANRTQLLVISFILTVVILAAMLSLLSQAAKLSGLEKGMIAGSLVMVWTFANLVYTLHYAHLFYTNDDGGKDCAGLEFPGTKEPVFADFVYFAFTLGVAVQTADVNITSCHIRKVVTAHCVAGFFFNLGVLALTINILASN